MHIIRLVSEGTVEEGMLKLASDKLQLEEDVTGVTSSQSFDEMDPTLSTVGISAMASSREEFVEPDITQEILGSSRFTMKRSQTQSEIFASNRSHRLTERELSSLLTDALKAIP